MKPNANLETTVGIFLLCGIGVICTLVILFAEIPDLFKPSYTIIVDFPDASGLLKGSDVYLSGALIGKVVTDPQPISDKPLVEVKLKIDKSVGIRKDAEFVIGSSGLLGDMFVNVRPKEYKEGEPKAEYVQDGDVLEGQPPTDMSTLMNSAQPLIGKANHIATQLDDIITKFNTEVLSGTSTEDLKETIAKLRDLVKNGDSTITNANDLLEEIKSGRGALGRLIYDKHMGNNLAEFIANLRVHGPVFYHDDTAEKGTFPNDNEAEALRKKYE